IRVALLAQRHWIDSYKHLKQRIDVCAEEVSSARLSVGHREHAMHVHRWLAVELRDVAAQRCNLHLLINRNDPVHLLLRIEPTEASIAKCADAGEVRARDVVVRSELRESSPRIVSGPKDYCVLGRSVSTAIQRLHPHAWCCAVRGRV